MLQFVAYMLTPVIVLGAGFGAYYMYDSEAAHLTAIQWTWSAINCYVQLTDYFKTPVKKIQKQPRDTTNGKSNIIKHSQSLVYYVESEKNTYITDILTEKSLELIQSSKPLIMFLRTHYKNMVYCKRTQNPLASDTEYLTLVERPFIQVEFVETGQKPLDIHSQLGAFYVEGNIILDMAFLKWYLQYYYDRSSFGEYTLKIFDKDVNMFTLSSIGHILIQDGGYTIVDGEVTETSDTETSDKVISSSDGEESEVGSEEEKTSSPEPEHVGVTALKDEKHWQMLQESGKKIVVDFTATWCGPCRRIKPFFHTLADDAVFSRMATFVSCDVDECQELAMAAGVSAMPTFQVWQNGKKLGETLGADKNNLKNLVMRYLSV